MTGDEQTRNALTELSSLLIDQHIAAAAVVARELTFVQLGVVAQIRRSKVATVSSIAEHASVAVSTASRWVDRLQALGLASRQPAEHSRREVVVSLTALGDSVATRWDSARVEIWEHALDGLDPDQLAPVVQSMRAAAGAAQEPSDDIAATAGIDPAHRPSSALLLSKALLDAAPDEIATTVVETAARAFEADVTLRVATHDGRYLNALAHARGGDRNGSSTPLVSADSETIDRSRPGDAFRTGTPVVDTEGPWTLHTPVTTVTHRVGVLSITPAHSPTDNAQLVEDATVLAAAAGPYLASPMVVNRVPDLAARSRPWTIGAEMQARQLGPSRASAHGITIAARTEPAFDTCTDSYDIELIGVEGRPTFDIAVLDSEVHRYSAPLVTGLALGALRNARALGLDLSQQAHLLDEAVFGHFRGEATVAFLLMRVDCLSRACTVIATAGIDLVCHGSTAGRMPLRRVDPAGLTGESEFDTASIEFSPGDRIAILGDGFAENSASGRRAETIVARSRTTSADEVVRSIGTDLLDRTGVDGPQDDATVVCIDFAGGS